MQTTTPHCPPHVLLPPEAEPRPSQEGPTKLYRCPLTCPMPPTLTLYLASHYAAVEDSKTKRCSEGEKKPLTANCAHELLSCEGTADKTISQSVLFFIFP